ncbi:GTPase domain-containing protein [Frigidibacter sp.]|uniref:GTPase domain-containing protein n=1 Tax=Frigidibacter sp. TaxID=2586418 RepID=UPI00273612D6|nr:GTPase domain-containing protein [Frigidibacter sp.]MDP3341975.1 GTPase domain-containing protein [Frigidibacter sp.]
MRHRFERLWQKLSPSSAPTELPPELTERPLPVIWLLGKTGAGKSTLVRALTGLPEVVVGNGFAPCTRASMQFDFPQDLPLMRFLDTRGLGEAGYDPAEDLALCKKASHVIVVVARLDDPVQGEVADVLATLRRRQGKLRALVVHTGADLLGDAQERFRARSRTQALFDKAAGAPLKQVELSLPAVDPIPAEAVQPLTALLDEMMPEVALALAREEYRAGEPARWATNRAEVLWYAGAAGTADVAPVVGAVAVPGVQAAMLRALAARYGVEWTRARFYEFAAALGTGAALRFGASYGLRQLAKLIPVFGQTVGAAAAGTLSFAATYALGRAAAAYLHSVSEGQAVTPQTIRTLYKGALAQGRHDPS